MRLTRRGLFKAAAAVPIALTVGVPAAPERMEFAGRSPKRLDTSMEAIIANFKLLRDDPGVWKRASYRDNWGVEMRFDA